MDPIVIYVYVCFPYAVLSVPCSRVITCCDLLALLCVMFSCVFVIFPYGVLGQVWYLIVSFPDLCLLLYFKNSVSFLVYNLSYTILACYFNMS